MPELPRDASLAAGFPAGFRMGAESHQDRGRDIAPSAPAGNGGQSPPATLPTPCVGRRQRRPRKLQGTKLTASSEREIKAPEDFQGTAFEAPSGGQSPPRHATLRLSAPAAKSSGAS